LPTKKSLILLSKLLVTLIGLVCLVYGSARTLQLSLFALKQGTFGVVEAFSLFSGIVLISSGALLTLSIPSSLRVRFKRARLKEKTNYVYGFGSTLAIGIGATLGSPLFVLIPENIVQYEFVSLGALVLATALSVFMAKVYSDMYITSKQENLGALGGPSFTKVACGTRSMRYFVSRVSMWIANTALAAYSKLVLIIFEVEFFPPILRYYGVNGILEQSVVYGLAILLIAWAVVSALYEKRLLKAIGRLQIVSTAALILILVYESVLLGDKGDWNLSGLFNIHLQTNWISSLVIDTGYLYILFFGFQEIQALERDTFENSSIPLISWMKKGYKMEKTKYLGVSMIASVVIAAIINILYALAVYSVHPTLNALEEAQIPALYLAKTLLGVNHELLMAIAFLLATFTTFVPSYLAASRHLAALGEDGFLPQTIGSYSWLFTLIWIILLAFGPQDFLVNITDIMVLISLGFITLSGIWLRKHGFFMLDRRDLLPLFVGLSCFVAGGSVFFIDPKVTVFGALTIILMYFVYDAFELGTFGVSLFLAFLNALTLLSSFSIPKGVYPATPLDILGFNVYYSVPPHLTQPLLALAITALLGNAFMDTALLKTQHKKL
jgi:hypothetical protein